MDSIFNYTNYQVFLKEYYEGEKSKKKFFSYQYLADHCGFKSKTYLYKVIKGDKTLTIEGARKVGAFLKFKKREQAYFEAIVHFTNAKTVDERELYFEKLQKLSKNSISSILRQYQFDYFNNWYNAVVRELISIFKWNGDYVQLAKMVVPEITVREAKQSVKLLIKSGLITVDEHKVYRRCNKAITTGADVVSLAVNHFQKENLQLAAEAIDRFERGDRDISTLTVSVSKPTADKIQEEIALFRKKIIGLVDKEREADRVYQINFQAFPISTSVNKEEQ